MIFEYLPTNVTQDIERLCLVCNALPITHILIPSNPVSKPYPDSLSVVTILQNLARQTKELEYIHFIPTIKTSLHTIESLQSVFLSLEYLNISHVAIISGDTTMPNQLSTYNALEILKDMQRYSAFLRQLQIYCALGSNISWRNSDGLCKKIQYGVRNFITQPFYHAQNTQENTLQFQHNSPYFLPQVTNDFKTFRSFYRNLIKIYTKNNLNLASSQNKIQIYCGFLPLSHARQAHTIHAKNLGISIPTSYINAIAINAKATNRNLFKALQQYNLSLSYLTFSDIKMLLDYTN